MTPNQPKTSKTKKNSLQSHKFYLIKPTSPHINNIVNDKTSLLEINQHLEYHKIINNSC